MLKGIGAKLKNKAIKTAIKAQLKRLPPQQREIVEALLDKNPELFEKMMADVEQMVKEGKDQMSAMMEVGRKYQSELQKLLMQK